MNIILVTLLLGPGGAERQVCDLADSFHDAGHAVSILNVTGPVVFTPKNPDIKISKLAEENNAKIIRFARFEKGEGLQKREENFAEEVAKQLGN